MTSHRRRERCSLAYPIVPLVESPTNRLSSVCVHAQYPTVILEWFSARQEPSTDPLPDLSGKHLFAGHREAGRAPTPPGAS